MGHRNNCEYKKLENEVMELIDEIKSEKDMITHALKIISVNKGEIERLQQRIESNNKTVIYLSNEIEQIKFDAGRLETVIGLHTVFLFILFALWIFLALI